ncbi:MAG: response regulator transcription factor [Eubacteriales bacterium]
MEKNKILVVDDEERIVEFVESYLLKNNYEVCKAYDGREALDIFEKEDDISLIVLDLMMPFLSGEQVCKEIRKTSRVPIIMLTAKVEEESILKGLDIGADDYITKPFSPRQLVARVGALLRRAEGGDYAVSSFLSYDNNKLTIDTIKYEVIKDGKIVDLTPNEYRILYTMAKSPQRVFSRNDIINIALADDFSGYDRAVDSHIKNLRQKIEDDTKNPRYIITVHGVGYKFGG